MKNILLFLVMIVLFSGTIMAVDTVEYFIEEENTQVKIHIDSANNLELNLPVNVDNLKVNATNYSIIETQPYDTLLIHSGNDVAVSYSTNSLIEKSNEEYFFIVRSPYEGVYDVYLTLSEEAVLLNEEDRLLVPNPTGINTNGRNILISWENFNSDEIIVSYEFLNQRINFWPIILILLAFLAIFYKRKEISGILFRKKNKKKLGLKDLTRNIFGEEKEIVEYLYKKDKKESWTKEIVRDLGISKVKLSRRLRNLEQKGLIEKIPFGNENKIRLVEKG